MKTPVLMLVFNRPDLTQTLFDIIRAARPERLYVAADGPRPTREGEAERCAEVRRIVTAIDWPCEVKTLFREANLGCRLAVSGGIGWFFDQEPEGIVLEDDIHPDPSFFPYCEALLERYRDDPQVAIISGCNMVDGISDRQAGYRFSRHALIWGWASWRRTWQHYDIAMTGWPSPEARARLAAMFDGHRLLISNWSAIFDRMARGEIDTWDYQLQYSAWMHGMLSIIPAHTLIVNEGFRSDATHTTGPMPKAPLPRAAVFPLMAPHSRTTGDDARLEREFMGVTRLRWAKTRVSAAVRGAARQLARR